MVDPQPAEPLRIESEYGAVEVSLDQEANGPRLRLHDQRAGRTRWLDPLLLESLVWTTDEDLGPLLDPARGRWQEEGRDPRSLVEAVYPALAAGDRETLTGVLAPDFVATFASGLPAPIGGRHEGREAAIAEGWWQIGRRFAVRAHPEVWLPSADAIVVLGRYRGRHREGEGTVDAAFAHVWRAAGGWLTGLDQITDTVAWGL